MRSRGARGAHLGGELHNNRLGGVSGQEAGGRGDRGGDHGGGLLLRQDQDGLEELEGCARLRDGLQEGARVLVEDVHGRCLARKQVLLDPALTSNSAQSAHMYVCRVSEQEIVLILSDEAYYPALTRGITARASATAPTMR